MSHRDVPNSDGNIDPAVRDRALTLLRTYLTSGRESSSLEMLKLWKGLFYSMMATTLISISPQNDRLTCLGLYHTPRTESQPLLSSLALLTLETPRSVFLVWTSAFWLTIGMQVPQLDANRIDKFLTLQRRMLCAQMTWLARDGWEETILGAWVKLMGNRTDGPLGLGGEGEKVGDGVRYHVLDVLPDEIVSVAETETTPVAPDAVRRILDPVRTLAEKGRGKVLRQKARDVLENEDLVALLDPEHEGSKGGREAGANDADEDDEEWAGIEG